MCLCQHVAFFQLFPRHIEEIAEDIETQLLESIKTSLWYGLKVDKSTDIDKALRLVYVRYLYQEDVHEDLLCALSLPTKTGAELFKSSNGYKSISEKLKWSFCVAYAQTELCHDWTTV